MDDDGPVPTVHDTNLRQTGIPGRADKHGEAIVEILGGDGIADSVQHVFIGDAVPSSTVRDMVHTQASYLAKSHFAS
jgi:hypothetical protein